MKPHITALIRAILILTVLRALVGCSEEDLRPGAYWCWLNGTVKEVGEVSIDGQALGTAWTFPFRVKVPAKWLGKGPHLLEIIVTNVWNNRLVGDRFLPEEKRITRTNMQGQHTKNSPLVPSGLIGPVTLRPVKQN